MLHPLHGKWKKTPAEAVLPWLFGFVLAAVMIFGYVRLYELRLSNEADRAYLAELSEELGELKKELTARENALEGQAPALGLSLPDPAEIRVVHVRGAEDEPGPEGEYMGRDKAYSGREAFRKGVCAH